MINSKKLLSIVCVFAIVVSMFSAMTVSAATIPAANLDITFNKTESTKSNLVFDVTTSAEYVSAGSIVMDITPIWSMISGSNFTAKGNTIKAVSTFGSAISSNVSENAATAKFSCLTTKKLKIQLAASTSALPFDFVTAESNVIAQIVIPLTSELTEEVTLSLDSASTYLAAGVYDETSDSGYAFEDQYLGKAMTATATSWAISFEEEDPVDADAILGDDEATGTADKTKTWTVTVGKNIVGKALKATLTNDKYEVGTPQRTQTVDLTFDSSISGDASLAFDVIVHFYNAASAATTTLDIALAE